MKIVRNPNFRNMRSDENCTEPEFQKYAIQRKRYGIGISEICNPMKNCTEYEFQRYAMPGHTETARISYHNLYNSRERDGSIITRL